MPDKNTRISLITSLLHKHNKPLTTREIDYLADLTQGYSGSDLTALAKDAALGPIRELSPDQVRDMEASQVRGIMLTDFIDSLKRIRRSVPPETLAKYVKWNQEYGDITS